MSRSIWHSIWHSTWHLIWHSTWYSIWHIFWRSISHSTWQSVWHFFWQSIRHSIYLASMLTYFWYIFRHSFLHFLRHSFWHYLWHLCWHSTLHFTWHIFWHSTWNTWHIFWQSIWHSFWHSVWHMFWHSIWQSFWHSISHVFGSSHARPQGPELAVWSSGPGVPTASGPCNTIRCSGPGVLAFGARDMGFGSRRAPQPPGLAVRFGSQGTARAEMRRRRRRSCTFVKIWPPSLAGVEKQNLSQPVSPPSFCLTGPSKQTKWRGMQKARH